VRRAPTAAVAVVVAFALVSCGEAEDGASAEPTATAASPSASPSPTAGEDAATESIEIEIEGDRVTPNGKQVEVAAGEEVTFAVTSDRAAELHVHSSPEQLLEVGKGETTATVVIERPGLVDVEEHETGLVVVQLEVR
jgi:plastocyanin